MDKQELKTYFSHKLGWKWSIPAQMQFNFLIRAGERAKGGVILDAGAGYQRYKPFFQESIYVAQEHPEAGAKNKGITKYDILSDVKCIPLEDNSVDCVLSTSALEHVEFPDEFFSEAYRVLKPGGTLFISVPFSYPEHEIPYDFQRPTRYGLRRWYSKAGFEKIQVEPMSSSIYTATVFIRDAVYEGHGGIRNAFRNSPRVFFRLVPRYFVFYFLVKPVLSILFRMLSKYPDESTLFPIGWAAEGRKPGVDYSAFRWNSKDDFLRGNIKKDFVYEGGVIKELGGV